MLKTRLEFTLYLFENIKRLRDPVRLVYRFLYPFRRFGNLSRTTLHHPRVRRRIQRHPESGRSIVPTLAIPIANQAFLLGRHKFTKLPADRLGFQIELVSMLRVVISVLGWTGNNLPT